MTHVGPWPPKSLTFRLPFARWGKGPLSACGRGLGPVHRAGGGNTLPREASEFLGHSPFLMSVKILSGKT